MARDETTASPESTEAVEEDTYAGPGEPLDEPREDHAPDLYHYDTYAETLETLDDITDEQITKRLANQKREKAQSRKQLIKIQQENKKQI